MSQLKSIIKRLAPQYEFYRIFKCELPAKQVQLANQFDFCLIEEQALKKQALYVSTQAYQNESSLAFGITHNNNLIAIQWYWYGHQVNKLDWWSTPENSAMSMHIQVAPEYQGQGVSTQLKSLALAELKKLGFQYAFSRVWHNHWASIAMNRKLKAKQVGWLVRLFNKNFHAKYC